MTEEILHLPCRPPPAADTGAGPDPDQADRRARVSDLYATHALGLIRLAYLMLGSRPAAEDVVQEAFFGLYRRWWTIGDHAKALNYVRSAVINGCRSELRRRRPGATSAEAVTASAEEIAVTRQRGRDAISALRSLPDRQREVLVLRFYLDYSDAQIAEALGIGQSTVRSTAHRALAALARQLKETP